MIIVVRDYVRYGTPFIDWIHINFLKTEVIN